MEDPSSIHAKLEALTHSARARMAACNPGISGVMGGCEIDFMTSDERAERHRLLLLLPTAGEERAEAAQRLQLRIAERRLRAQTRVNETLPLFTS